MFLCNFTWLSLIKIKITFPRSDNTPRFLSLPLPCSFPLPSSVSPFSIPPIHFPPRHHPTKSLIHHTKLGREKIFPFFVPFFPPSRSLPLRRVKQWGSGLGRCRARRGRAWCGGAPLRLLSAGGEAEWWHDSRVASPGLRWVVVIILPSLLLFFFSRCVSFLGHLYSSCFALVYKFVFRVCMFACLCKWMDG